MLRFTIRDALLLTAVSALCLGWWLDRQMLANELKEVQARADLWVYRAGAVADGVSGEGWKINWTPGGVDMSKAAARME